MKREVRDVLVLVPGLLGSELERNGKRIWGGTSVAGTFLDPAALRLTGDGFSPDPEVRPTRLIASPTQFPGLTKMGGYSRLVNRIRRRLDLDDSNFLTFAYDWRLSCQVNASLLGKKVWPLLERRRRRYPDAQLIFVCHSLGGLVVQQFTDLLGGAIDTKGVVTLGTPFRGAVGALAVMSYETSRLLPRLRARFRNLARTFPSVYELLPRYRAVIDGQRRRHLRASDLPDGVRQEVFEATSLVAERMEIQTPRLYERTVLVGSLQRTPQFVRFRDGLITVLKEWDTSSRTIDERGDGTVPRQSVAPPEWKDDRRAVPLGQTHVGLASDAGTFRILFNMLTATPRNEQAGSSLGLALEVTDLIPSGQDLLVSCEIPAGDRATPLLVAVVAAESGLPIARQVPKQQGPYHIAKFDHVPPGDYIVTVQPASTDSPHTRVWDLVTVVDSATVES